MLRVHESIRTIIRLFLRLCSKMRICGMLFSLPICMKRPILQRKPLAKQSLEKFGVCFYQLIVTFQFRLVALQKLSHPSISRYSFVLADAYLLVLLVAFMLAVAVTLEHVASIQELIIMKYFNLVCIFIAHSFSFHLAFRKMTAGTLNHRGCPLKEFSFHITESIQEMQSLSFWGT